jgi:hypothetical protein
MAARVRLACSYDFHAFPTVNREPANRKPEQLQAKNHGH